MANPANALVPMLAGAGRRPRPGAGAGLLRRRRAARRRASERNSRRCPSTRRSSCSKIGVDGLARRRGLYDARTPLGPARRTTSTACGAAIRAKGPRRCCRPGPAPSSAFGWCPTRIRKRSPPRCEKRLRELCPPGITMELVDFHGAPGVVVPLDSPYVAAAEQAIEEGFGRRPVFIREGGSIPVVATFHDLLGVDTLLLGWGLDDDNTHSPNEKFCLADFHRGIKASAYLWQHLGSLKSDRLTARRPGSPAQDLIASDRSMLDRRFVVENVELVQENCRRRGSQADVRPLCRARNPPPRQASRSRRTESPGQRGQQVDRQGQGPRRARGPQGRRPRAARSKYSRGTAELEQLDRRGRRHPATRSPTCRIPTRRSAPTTRRTWNCAAASTHAADVRLQAAATTSNWAKSST